MVFPYILALLPFKQLLGGQELKGNGAQGISSLLNLSVEVLGGAAKLDVHNSHGGFHLEILSGSSLHSLVLSPGQAPAFRDVQMRCHQYRKPSWLNISLPYVSIWTRIHTHYTFVFVCA